MITNFVDPSWSDLFSREPYIDRIHVVVCVLGIGEPYPDSTLSKFCSPSWQLSNFAATAVPPEVLETRSRQISTGGTLIGHQKSSPVPPRSDGWLGIHMNIRKRANNVMLPTLTRSLVYPAADT